jgi:hypothetical protein
MLDQSKVASTLIYVAPTNMPLCSELVYPSTVVEHLYLPAYEVIHHADLVYSILVSGLPGHRSWGS